MGHQEKNIHLHWFVKIIIERRSRVAGNLVTDKVHFNFLTLHIVPENIEM